MIIDYVTSPKSGGAETAYPMLKWKRALQSENIDIRISNKFPNKNSSKAEVIVLTEPFYRDRFDNNPAFHAARDTLLCRDFLKAREISDRVVYFDTGDSTVCRYLHLLSEVDLMLKWQTLKDKDYYCSVDYEEKPLIWSESGPIRVQRAETSHIHKLQVGWNLAYRNYSLFRRGARHLHWKGVTWNPRFTRPRSRRPILTSFRGAVHGLARGSHRQKAVAELEAADSLDILLGASVSRRRYLRELRKTKAVVSPFGYGEPCYRDMEAFIAGAILVKPSMEHLETFPDLYRANITYLPVRWDFEDLPGLLDKLATEYSRFLPMAEAAQQEYKRVVTDPSLFVGQWRRLLRLLDLKI